MKYPKTFALLGLLLATQASAHGLWTEQRRGNIEVIYGHGAEDNAFKAQKISGAWAYDPVSYTHLTLPTILLV